MIDFINDKVGALIDVDDDIALEREITKILKETRTFDKEKLAK